MGFQVTTGAWFYIIVMLIVIYIGIAIVTGLNPLTVFSKIGHIFEPGKLYITNDNPQEGGLAKFTKIDCSETAPIVILDGLKFFYKAEPASRSESFKFVVIMDYKAADSGGLPTQSKLIIGRHNGVEVIECRAKGREFECPQDLKLEFRMEGIGNKKKKEVFHFTTWKDRAGVLENARSTNFMSNMLGANADAYVSSFDVAKDKQLSCQETECRKQVTEDSCRSTSNCYWGPWYLPWAKKCSRCEVFTECSRYDKDQCVQCDVPRIDLGCTPTLTGCGN